MPKPVTLEVSGKAHKQLKNVRVICCGAYHSACVADPGMLYTWGNGYCLGRVAAPPVKVSLPSGVNRAGRCRGAGATEPTSAGAGNGAAAIVSGASGVGVLDSCVPELVPFFAKKRVQYVCSGEGHLLAKTAGDLYAWGHNKHGQLGRGTMRSGYRVLSAEFCPRVS